MTGVVSYDDDLRALLDRPPRATYPNAQMLELVASADLAHPAAMTFTIPLPVKPNIGSTMKYEGVEYRVRTWTWQDLGRYPTTGSDGEVYRGWATISLEAIDKPNT